jgi:hypothetical protein
MALSTKTFNTLVDALASKAAAQELVSLVNARAGTPSRNLSQSVIDAMARKDRGQEVLNALISGATLSLSASRRILIMMAGDATSTGGAHAAGNELINYIQSVPNAKNITL